MSRREWWLGVAILTIAILLHAVVPRYEWRGDGPRLVRIDRWTGHVVTGYWSRGTWVAGSRPSAMSPSGGFRPDDIDPPTEK